MGNQYKFKEIKDLGVNKEVSRADSACSQKKDFQYTLTVADNGKGIPEEINFRNTDSLGLQLVNILVEQIEGCLELRRNRGTEFFIKFNDISR